MSEFWKPLPSVPTSPREPCLYLKYHSDIDRGYVILLTDLATIWREQLDRSAINDRAALLGSSIDPADNPQCSQLLHYLKEAFSGRDQQNTVTLYRGSRPGDIIVKTRTCLPSPLRPLEWEFLLQKCSPSLFRAECVFPLISMIDAVQHQRDRAAEVLQEKDQVITRLVDALEANGINLESVFPVLSSQASSGLSRYACGRFVVGLDEFNKDQLEAWSGSSSHEKVLDKQRIDGIMKQGSQSLGSMESVNIANDSWHLHLSSTESSLSHVHHSQTTTGTTDDERHETQDDRPNKALVQGGSISQTGSAMKQEPALESSLLADINEVPQVSRASSFTFSNENAKRDQKQPAIKRETEDIERPFFDLRKNSAASDCRDGILTHLSSKSDTTSSKRSRLGAIGGRVSKSEKESSNNESKATASAINEVLDTVTKEDIGSMRPQPLPPGNAKAETGNLQDQREQADRRRDELEKELELKRKASPRKKKRRF